MNVAARGMEAALAAGCSQAPPKTGTSNLTGNSTVVFFSQTGTTREFAARIANRPNIETIEPKAAPVCANADLDYNAPRPGPPSNRTRPGPGRRLQRFPASAPTTSPFLDIPSGGARPSCRSARRIRAASGPARTSWQAWPPWP